MITAIMLYNKLSKEFQKDIYNCLNKDRELLYLMEELTKIIDEDNLDSDDFMLFRHKLDATIGDKESKYILSRSTGSTYPPHLDLMLFVIFYYAVVFLWLCELKDQVRWKDIANYDLQAKFYNIYYQYAKNTEWYDTYTDWAMKNFVKPQILNYANELSEPLENDVLYRIRAIDENMLDNAFTHLDIRKPQKNQTKGRANIKGHSVLYLASSIECCINEVAKNTLPEYILVGEFRAVKPLNIINMSTLDNKIPYDPKKIEDFSSNLEYNYLSFYIDSISDTISMTSQEDNDNKIYDWTSGDLLLLHDILKSSSKPIQGYSWKSVRKKENSTDQDYMNFMFYDGGECEFKVSSLYIQKLQKLQDGNSYMTIKTLI